MLKIGRALEQRQGIVSVAGKNDCVVALTLPICQPQRHVAAVPCHAHNLGAGSHARPELFRDALHVPAAAAGHGTPFGTPEPEHPVVVEEANRMLDRELTGTVGRRRPQGRSERHEEVVSEAPGVASRDNVLIERAAGVLEPAPLAADREGHLGRLGRNVQLPKQPNQLRVGAFVVNEEPGVKRQFAASEVHHHGVRVATEPPGSLEQGHLVFARQEIGRAETCDS